MNKLIKGVKKVTRLHAHKGLSGNVRSRLFWNSVFKGQQ